MPLDDPRTRTEILEALGHVQAEVASYFGSLGPESNQRTGDAWTPAEHLKHLVTSVNAVARGLAAPKLLLRLRFGRARAPSRSYAQVCDAYRAALAAGGRASGAFVPPPEVVSADDAGRRRAEILVCGGTGRTLGCGPRWNAGPSRSWIASACHTPCWAA